MIKKGLEKSSPFLCGKLDMLADWRKTWQAEKSAESAENLADPVKRKIWRKICGESGKSADPVQLRRICGKIH